jgi:large repetitive protein
MFKIYLESYRKFVLVASFTLISILGFAQTCTSYTAGNVNNFCGCTADLFKPYGMYLEMPNGCVEYFKTDTVYFIISSDSSAYLRGTFRNFADFRPVLVDIRLAKTTIRTPRLELCNRDSSASVAANWRYFGAMSGTIKVDTDPITTVSSRNGVFQMGIGATGQSATTFGAAGQFTMSDGRRGGFGFPIANPQPVACPAPINPCLSDLEPPTFSNCPANISVTTTQSTATATWTPPTAADNCSTPSITSNFTNGQSFPLGTTSIIYTARDAAGNTSQCRFSITVIQVTPPTGCVEYDAINTNNNCGCVQSLFSPYGIYLQSSSACGVAYYKPDTVYFRINADSTATLKGTFRSPDWTPIVVDIFFQKTTLRQPKFEWCNRDSSASIATTWRYFGAMSGTIKVGNDAPSPVSSRNGLFQVGTGANGQNSGILGAAGQFSLQNGTLGGFGFTIVNPRNVSCLPPPNLCLNDVTPPIIRNCPSNISITTAQPFSVATWTPPTATDNCGIQSFTSNFSSGQTFTIGTTTVFYTARDSSNNTAQCSFTITINQVLPPTGCIKYSVTNTNNFCGCTPSQFSPYGLYLQASNACGLDYYQVDSVTFQLSTDSTATIKGTFRSLNWTPVVVDIFLQKTTAKIPKFQFCNRDSSLTFAAAWRYFNNMVGSIKIGTEAPVAVSSRNGLFQLGIGANGQNAATLGATGDFQTTNGLQGGFGFSLTNPQNAVCIPPPNLCLNDATPPTLSNCPANISITTALTSAAASWTPPTATDNCGVPSVSSNFSSGQSFPVGSTTVTYTARDSSNNTATCSFLVTVRQIIPPTGCIKYNVENTNNFCGCLVSQFTPYGLYLQSANACGSEFYKADSVVFQINSDSTASLKGTFRSPNWTPLVVDIFFQKTTARVPRFELCNRDSTNLVTGAWRYFGNMIGTMKLGTNLPVSVASRNGLFQLGVGANGENPNFLGASGGFTMGNGQQGSFGFVLANPQNAICLPPPNFCANDIIPPSFNNCPASFTVNTPTTSAVVSWTAPTVSDNCTRGPSVSSNFSSPQTFSVGQNEVIYTARDSANNAAECRFTVTVRQVIPPTGCVKYIVDNTNLNCGCAEMQYKPFAIYVANSDNSCGFSYYKADSVTFQINADSSAWLKGTFRNDSWHPILVDIYFAKTNLRLPKLENCIRDSAASIASAWRYFGDMTGTIKFDNQLPVSVTSRNGVFQFGNSANGQNSGTLGASGQFTMGNGRIGGFAFSLSNVQNAVCLPTPNFCLNDVIPPAFTNCPADIVVGTRQSSATAAWATITATDNCSNPSVSGNFASGTTFPLGTTNVIYTAIDAANNRTECRFAVKVNQIVDLNCKRYPINNTQNICGCAASQWTPFSFYLENPTTNGCNTAYFKSDDAYFQVNEDSSATLRGTFRSPTWQPVFVNLTFAKTTLRQPKIEGCNRDSAASIAANWRYFGAVRGTMQFDSIGILNLTNGTNLLQFGNGANNQNTRDLGVSGLFTMSNGQKGGFNFSLGAMQAVACTTELNPCLNDVTKPVFNTCPSTVNVGTLQTSSVANWVIPTAFDNCAIASVTSTHTSGQTFPIGVTTVAYTARDLAGNTSVCSFAVNVFRAPTPTGCNKYDVKNTNNNCGCADLLWQPYGMYLESPNRVCGLEYFKADSVSFVTNSDSTGSLRGRFRSSSWQPIYVNLTFAKTTLKTPRLENCNRDSAASAAANWKYLGQMTGSIRYESGDSVIMNSRNGGFQFGIGANGQDARLLGANGQFTLANGRLGGFAFLMENPQVIACPIVPNPCYPDSIPPVFNNCPTNINVATSQNSIVINWTSPTARDNCGTPLVLSNFQPGQSLPIGQTTVVYLARDTAGNQTECRFVVTVTKISPTQDLTNTPFEILRFAPNPATNTLNVDAASPLQGNVVFNLINALGQVLEQKTQYLNYGENHLIFDVSHLAKGVYWLKPSAINGEKAMIKFVKM